MVAQGPVIRASSSGDSLGQPEPVPEPEQEPEPDAFLPGDNVKIHSPKQQHSGKVGIQRCAVCTREYSLENLPAVVSHRAVERLRESWSNQFKTIAKKDARFAAATKLYDRAQVCLFCFQFFDPDQEEDQNQNRPESKKVSVSVAVAAAVAGLEAALARRQDYLRRLDAEGTDCYRIIHGSGDGFDGLTVDRSQCSAPRYG